MALNPTKSDAILFGTPQRLKSVSGQTSVNVADSVIQLSGTVKILGATLDPSLTMGPHTKTLSKSCFHHIRSFRQTRSSMDHYTVSHNFKVHTFICKVKKVKVKSYEK